MIIEIIATTVREAIDIEKSGADRIELVSGILEGGLTPSIGLINEVCNTVNIPVNVMVRPHSKSFTYDEHDLKVIYQDIENIKKTKANGIVFGSLNSDKTIDFDSLKEVIRIKDNLKLTFHRAIDSTINIEKEFSKLCKYDIDTILTSAGKDKVVDNIPLINKFFTAAKKEDVKILAGSGIYQDNILGFIDETLIEEIHMGSGVKINRNNLNEIDTKLLSSLVNIINHK